MFIQVAVVINYLIIYFQWIDWTCHHLVAKKSDSNPLVSSTVTMTSAEHLPHPPMSIKSHGSGQW